MVTERASRVNFLVESRRAPGVGHGSSPMRPALLLVPAMLLAACHGGFKDGVFVKDGVRYEVKPPPETWRQVSLEGNDLAFVAPGSGHSIAVNSTCRDTGDPPLEVLVMHLLIGFTDRVRVSQEPGMLDGRASLAARYTAKLDGVPVELFLVVTKKDGCVYDFSYVSPEGRFDEQRAAFDSLVAHFKTGGER